MVSNSRDWANPLAHPLPMIVIFGSILQEKSSLWRKNIRSRKHCQIGEDALLGAALKSLTSMDTHRDARDLWGISPSHLDHMNPLIWDALIECLQADERYRI
jgi:hypothetical protein